MNEYPPIVAEVATAIAEVYSQFGNITSLYLGQGSPNLQLALFGPLYEETLTLFLALNGAEENAYTKSDDPEALFISRCQAIVQETPLWVTLQGKRKTTLPQDESDRGYVVIVKGFRALRNSIEHQPASLD
ncbi:MAG: hypothetical protein WC233_07640 [Sphaerochaeta sp.]|jgi:hypothetical protein|nr:hypothetical protein [Spirochaetales bacterium]